MSAEPIDPKHSVVAYASFTKHQDGKVDGSVFVRREADTDGLSVNWLEFHEPPRPNQIREISRCSGLTLKRSGRYAEVSVEFAAAAVAEFISDFSAVRDPLEIDPSHSLFLGLPAFNEELAQLIGDRIAIRVSELHEPFIENS